MRRSVPIPTPIYRLMHIDNLHACLHRGGIHSPSSAPSDGPAYRVTHNAHIQSWRGTIPIPCGPGGMMHDYVPFYFGVRSPMLFQLKNGRVPGYTQGQAPLVYLVSTVQRVVATGLRFVFSDGHGLARFTDWYDKLGQLDRVDWSMVSARYWADSADDTDRQRRKQAELLIHRFCPMSLITEIGVLDASTKQEVEHVLHASPPPSPPLVTLRRAWYY